MQMGTESALKYGANAQGGVSCFLHWVNYCDYYFVFWVIRRTELQDWESMAHQVKDQKFLIILDGDSPSEALWRSHTT